MKEENNTINILVAGLTGAGKSTLVKAVRSSCQGNRNAIRFWGTLGLEIDSARIEEIIKSITEKKETIDQLHVMWYCINSNCEYDVEEQELVKGLYSTGIPIIIVLTQCVGDENKINNNIRRLRGINSSCGMGDIPIVKILSLPYVTRIGTVSSFGMDDLLGVTFRVVFRVSE